MKWHVYPPSGLLQPIIELFITPQDEMSNLTSVSNGQISLSFQAVKAHRLKELHKTTEVCEQAAG
jgi:hypothetical protein